MDELLANATDHNLWVAEDAISRWACVPGSLADKLRQQVRLAVEAEINARAERD